MSIVVNEQNEVLIQQRLELTGNKNRSRYLLVKRLLDLIVAVLMIVICLPVISVFMIIIVLETRRHPVYVQLRGVSLEQGVFSIYKLRTLKDSFKKKPDRLSEVFIKNSIKPSVTRFGYWLRKSGLDEILQVFNVLSGKMSIVGPRPLSVDDLMVIRKEQPVLYQKRSIITSRPGITGLWQIQGNRDQGIYNLIKLDEEYERNKSFLLDLKILLRTVPLVIFARNSDAILFKKEDINNSGFDFRD